MREPEPKVKEKAVSGARAPFAGFLRCDNKVEEIFPEYLIALQPSGLVMGEGGRSSPLIYGRLSMKTGMRVSAVKENEALYRFPWPPSHD